MLALMFGLVPLLVVLLFTWFVASATHSKATGLPLAGFLMGLGIVAWIMLAPDSMTGSSFELVVPIALITVAAGFGFVRTGGIAGALIESCVASVVVVVALTAYGLIGEGDGSGLDAVAFVLFWGFIYLPGTIVGAAIGAGIQRVRRSHRN